MAITGLDFSHLGLYVKDLDKQTDFYTRVLEFTVTDRGTLPGPGGKPVRLVFMSRNPEEHHQLVFAESAEPSGVFTKLINQLSLRADGLGTLRTLHERFVAEGLERIEAAITHGNALSLYALDPEGVRLECYIDLPWYVDQPFRVPVDFAMNDETLMAHLESHARSLPGFKPRTEWVQEMKKRMGIEA
nr:VOC family protein [uncultured Pseudomonas sp.]